MRTLALLIVMPLILASSIVSAGQQGLPASLELVASSWDRDRERLLNMSDDELINLLEHSRKEEAARIVDLVPERMTNLPARLLVRAAFPEKFGDLAISIPLRQLLYQGTPEGVGQFQADIGAKPTGEMTFGEFMELMRRHRRQRDTSVYVRADPDIFVNKVTGKATVKGTWVWAEEGIASPITTTEITCDPARGECLSAEAKLDVPPIDDNDGLLSDRYYLSVDTDTYTVVSWEADKIVARGDRCGTSLLTLNLRSNEVQEVASGNETCESRVARLVSGWQASEKFWRKRVESTCAYVNPRIVVELRTALGIVEGQDGCKPDVGSSPRKGAASLP